MSTPTPRTQADARQRALRTLLQGLGVDVLVAAAAALLLWLPDADLTSREAVTAVLLAMVKSALTAAASYVTRLRVPPSAAPMVTVVLDRGQFEVGGLADTIAEARNALDASHACSAYTEGVTCPRHATTHIVAPEGDDQ